MTADPKDSMLAKFGRMRWLLGAVRRRLSGAISGETELANRVDFAYRQCVGRAADPRVLQRYTSALRNGMPFASLVEEIMASAEAQRHRQDTQKDLAICINLACEHGLGRAADADELQRYAAALRSGTPLSQVLQEIAASSEAKQRRKNLDRDMVLYVDIAYWHYCGRAADPDGLQFYTTALRNGAPLAQVLQEIEKSSEAEQRRQSRRRDLALCVDLIYWHCYGRAADADGLQYYTTALRSGTPLSQVLQDIEARSDAKQRRRGLGGYFDELSDGEFIFSVAELLFERGAAVPNEIEYWRKFLGETRAKRIELIRNLINAYIDRQRQDGAALREPHQCLIPGTKRFLTQAVWQEKTAELKLAGRPDRLARPVPERPAFKHSGEYTVSAIASLYKGRRFLEAFLDNITSQTIFDRSELIIVDANSPEGEEEIVAEYQKTYPNIVYKRINYRIGIYDAWNVGVEVARGKYLTNVNLDDLRRRDSFELQASALDANPSADVIYQDVFYTFDPSLSFDDVARLGFKTELPIITAHNLLMFNSPHNAPMWRKVLHEEVGLFDTSFKSAGDWEFWLRCLCKGKKFFKINTPHVVYYHNPEGLSTRPDTRGIEEGRQVWRRYSRKLISGRLLLSRQAFADLLGIAPDWDRGVSYYEVVQRELSRVGERYKLGIGEGPHQQQKTTGSNLR